MSVTWAILMTWATATGQTSDAVGVAPGPRRSPSEVITAASGAEDLYVLEPPGPDGFATSLVPAARFDAARDVWVVDLFRGGRVVFRVVVDDAAGTVTDQAVVAPDGRLMRVADVRARVVSHPDVLALARSAPRLDAVLTYSPKADRWRVRVLAGDAFVASATVGPGGVTVTRVLPPDSASPVGRLAVALDRLRPHMGYRQWILVCAVVFVALFAGRGRFGPFGTADALVLAAQVPIGFLLGPLPRIGYPMLMATTVYLFARAVAAGLRHPRRLDNPPPAAPRTRARGSAGLVALAALLLIVHAGMARSADTSVPGTAGLVGGERYLDTGVMPYGQTKRGFDEYGPLHYLLHGLAARVWPSGEDWRTFDADLTHEARDDTGARVVAFLFHVLTAVALVGIGRKHLGSTRTGWMLMVAYLLLAPNLEYLLHASKRAPAAFVMLAFWAFPSPIGSAVLLGLGTAAYWFPVFLVPLWLSAFRGRGAWRFGITYAAAGVVFLGLVLWGPGRADARLRTVFEATAHAEEGVAGNWDRYADVEGFWGPLVRLDSRCGWLRVGITVAFLAFCLVLWAWPRARRPLALAGLTAAVVVGTQIWKSNQTGEYIGWYLPILLVALFGRRAAAVTPPAPHPPVECGADPV